MQIPENTTDFLLFLARERLSLTQVLGPDGETDFWSVGVRVVNPQSGLNYLPSLAWGSTPEEAFQKWYAGDHFVRNNRSDYTVAQPPDTRWRKRKKVKKG